MKKIILFITAMLLPLCMANAKQLWEYGSFTERAETFTNISNEEYIGSYEQNISLLDYYENNTYLKVLSNPYTREEAVENYDDEVFGAQRPSDFETTLGEKLDPTASTTEDITLTSLTTRDGHTLTSADIGDFMCLKINPGASNQELVCCTGGISGSDIQDCQRGYSLYQNAVEGSKEKRHSPGEVVIISNDDAYLQEQYAQLDNPNTYYGTQTFASTTADSRINIGDSSTTYDKVIYAYNGETNLPYLLYDESANTWSFSNDGVSSTAIGSGASVYTAGNGIDITASVITLATSSLSGLRFDNDGLLQLSTSTGTGIYVDTDGYIKIATTSDFNFTGGFKLGDNSTASSSALNTITSASTTPADYFHTHQYLSAYQIDNSASSVTGQTEATLASFTIPGADMSDNSRITMIVNGGISDDTVGSHIKVNFGGYTIATSTTMNYTANPEDGGGYRLVVEIQNINSQNTQDTFFTLQSSASQANERIQASSTPMAVDTSQDQTLEVIGWNDGASATITASTTIIQLIK